MTGQKKTVPIIFDLNIRMAGFDGQVDVDVSSGSVLADVGERLLHEAQQLYPC